MSNNKKVGITDTTLRDAHQSLWATRMRTEDMLPIVGKMDQVGYHAMEVWGGATFDVCMRYLDEDPWERLQLLDSYITNTPLQMLLRAQNVVGYKHYPDDVVRKFVHKAAENGIDRFRIFDALNDVRNMKTAIEAVKETGKHIQATVVYTISPVHTIEHYIETAVTLQEMGAHSLCIKDMAGLLKPYRAYELVSALKEKIDIPIELHSHYIGGMAISTYLKGVEAGADVIDTATASLAFGSSQPPVETMNAIWQDTDFHVNLDFDLLFDIDSYFERVRRKRGFSRGVTKITDMQTFAHQVPGGMISNLVSQLEKQEALDQIHDVLKEIPRVRKDLGYPPLVTPTSQIVGTQAVFNVLLGERYKVIPDEVKSYIKGYYGQPPAEINPEIQKKAIGEEEPITCRPADLLESTLDNIKDEVEQYVEKEEDYLSYALFPQVGLKFLKQRKKNRDIFGEEEPEVNEEITNQEIISREAQEDMDLKDIKELVGMLDETEISEINLESDGTKVSIKKGGQVVTQTAEVKEVTKAQAPAKKEVVKSKPATSEDEAKAEVTTEKQVDGEEIEAPMVGTFYRCPSPDADAFVEVGDVVEEGDTICIIEAMKLMNEIEAEYKCKIVDILVDDAAAIEYGQPLFLVERL
ncbi:acetyl-CoA carboxylase, biotin carboxyl carrier protein [Halobacteroides halobius DSM 5150]|uniref:Acetyl-CoA carboxylase, biotin carboxyl carrier protein n=1 Tax=Halobacteroides halobius (strain ATCC 35273 / DSM 5150 / MD-1) TaxID=748449 RepID=L0K7J2_HALHC|nr:acetyl-CoA carboxylase biotin carboxyl carrier protein [Halobacteroides halobius]AGB40515.1 acetyl-CoA carboxylase, biotin carboxyl carrier protein [Halobacteroides halobius DSM 5150]